MQLIIPAGGRGTRLLPLTKAFPKEMMPLGDRPILQYLIEEGINSGIEDIVVVISPSKRGIKKHFAPDKKLDKTLGDKVGLVKSLKTIAEKAKVRFAIQRRPGGDGHAVLCAKWKVNTKEGVAVVFGDTLFDAKEPVLAELISLYRKTGMSVIGVKEVPEKDVSKYGIVTFEKEGNLQRITGMQEKPKLSEAKSRLAIVGIYVLTPGIWRALKNCGTSYGEVRLSDALKVLLKSEKVYAHPITAEWLDTGDFLGYFHANLRIAKRHPQYGEEVKQMIRDEA